ncbi:MAG: hypothetical protein AB1414_18910 [bacterium]
MIKKFLAGTNMVVVSLFFASYGFAGILDDLKLVKDVEKIKEENKVLKEENANLKQQLTEAKKVSYQNIAQSKYRTTALIADNSLIDGDKQGSNLVPLWYELDFHYSRVIDKVVVYLTPAEKMIDTKFSFHYYDPVNQQWENLRSLNNEGKNIITLTFNPLTTSKLKIYSAINIPVAEIEVFGWVIEP